MKNKVVMELAIGKVKGGVSREDYLKAATAVERELRRMPGFRSRQLLAGEDGLWVDLVLWDSMEQALQAAEVFGNNPNALPMIERLDSETIHMYHLEPVYQDALVDRPIEQG